LRLDPEVLSALLDLEGLRRQPWRLSGFTRALALVRTVQLTKSCSDWGEEASRSVRSSAGCGGRAAWWNASTAWCECSRRDTG